MWLTVSVSVFSFIFFFFFKQKTAYEILAWLEFRRVLFRSPACKRMFFTCDEKRQWKSNIKYLVPAWERLTETKIKYFLFLPFSPPFPEFPLLVFTKHNADPQNIVTAFIARQTSQPFNIGALWKLQNNGTRIFFARGKPKDIFSSWGGYEYFDCALSITDEQSSANKKYVTLNSVNRWSESAQVFDLTFLVCHFILYASYWDL